MTIRDLALTGQLVLMKACEDDLSRAALREVGDIELSAPFPVQSAVIFWAGTINIAGKLYENRCEPGGVFPIGRVLDFKLEKDLRRKNTFWRSGGGAPVDPSTYGKWLLKLGSCF
jgi:hypothetical protein